MVCNGRSEDWEETNLLHGNNHARECYLQSTQAWAAECQRTSYCFTIGFLKMLAQFRSLKFFWGSVVCSKNWKHRSHLLEVELKYRQCRAGAYTLSTNFAYRTSVSSCRENLAATAMSLLLPVQWLHCGPSSNQILFRIFIRIAGFCFSHNFRILWEMLAKYCQM